MSTITEADYFTQADPPEVDIFEPVTCPAGCEETTDCSICQVDMCVDHSTEFTTCVDSPFHIHHISCARHCASCSAYDSKDR